MLVTIQEQTVHQVKKRGHTRLGLNKLKPGPAYKIFGFRSGGKYGGPAVLQKIGSGFLQDLVRSGNMIFFYVLK